MFFIPRTKEYTLLFQFYFSLVFLEMCAKTILFFFEKYHSYHSCCLFPLDKWLFITRECPDTFWFVYSTMNTWFFHSSVFCRTFYSLHSCCSCFFFNFPHLIPLFCSDSDSLCIFPFRIFFFYCTRPYVFKIIGFLVVKAQRWKDFHNFAALLLLFEAKN